MDKKNSKDGKFYLWRNQLTEKMCKLKQGEFGNI
jgi:hypothetical protein